MRAFGLNNINVAGSALLIGAATGDFTIPRWLNYRGFLIAFVLSKLIS